MFARVLSGGDLLDPRGIWLGFSCAGFELSDAWRWEGMWNDEGEN